LEIRSLQSVIMHTPISRFEELGVSGVIWANHQLRASTLAMQHVCQDLAQNHSIKDSPMVSVQELFRLQEQNKLNEDEKKYE